MANRASQFVWRPVYNLLALLSLALLFVSACSLAEDITPPPGLALTQIAAVTPTPEPSAPQSAPNTALGAAVYVGHCAACHGGAGQGDGPLAAQVQGQLPDFTSPEWRRALQPQEVFATITQGRLEKTMPPFGDSLSEAERWNVTAYLFSLSLTPEVLQQAGAVYAAQCMECHEQNDVSARLSAPDFFAALSETGLFAFLTESPATSPHAFASLTEAERWAASAKVRALGYVTAETAVAPSEGAIHVEGTVTNGTANTPLPDNLPVELYVFEQFTPAGIYTETVSDGEYRFSEVSVKPGQALIATVVYQGVRYTSRIGQFAGTEARLTLPLEIFETTADASVVLVESWHIFFNLIGPGQVRVGELMVFSNTGDRAYVGVGGATLEVSLPPGAANLQLQEGALVDRYQITSEGFAYTAPVLPGDQSLSVLFSFDMPLASSLAFEQAMRYPVRSLNVLVPPEGLKLDSDQLIGPQSQDVEGVAYFNYTERNRPANARLRLTLDETSAIDLESLWPALGALAVMALIGAGWFVWDRRRRRVVYNAPAPASGDRAFPPDLVEAIARLDEAFERGESPAEDYQRRRAQLKAKALGREDL
jgi:mono/diheme cytochrome c family protein